MKSLSVFFTEIPLSVCAVLRDKYLWLLCMRDRQWIALRSFFLYNEETGKKPEMKKESENMNNFRNF